jgi:hypothetical protein
MSMFDGSPDSDEEVELYDKAYREGMNTYTPTPQDSQAGDEPSNEKTPEGVSSSDKYSSIESITGKYDIHHPKSSISRNTARKMLNRDLIAYTERRATERAIAELTGLKKRNTGPEWFQFDYDKAFDDLNDRIKALKSTLEKEKI